jgi:hypothetical protein
VNKNDQRQIQCEDLIFDRRSMALVNLGNLSHLSHIGGRQQPRSANPWHVDLTPSGKRSAECREPTAMACAQNAVDPMRYR